MVIRQVRFFKQVFLFMLSQTLLKPGPQEKTIINLIDLDDIYGNVEHNYFPYVIKINSIELKESVVLI